MNIIKYFNPIKYVKRIKAEIAKLNLKLGRTFITKSNVLGHTIYFYVSSEKEYFWRALASYTEEKSTIYWVQNFINENDIVYDVGANVGAYSLLIAKLMKQKDGKGMVYSFEPESQNFASLNKNIIINDLSDYILGVPAALGDKLMLGKFYLSSNIPGSATHALNRPESEGIKFKPTHLQGIMAITLNQLIKLENVKFPNHIKIDVDGLEKIIVENMTDLLADRNLKTIIIEIAEHISNGGIERFITNYGFKEEYREEVGMTNGKKIFNLLFIRI